MCPNVTFNVPRMHIKPAIVSIHQFIGSYKQINKRYNDANYIRVIPFDKLLTFDVHITLKISV